MTAENEKCKRKISSAEDKAFLTQMKKRLFIMIDKQANLQEDITTDSLFYGHVFRGHFGFRDTVELLYISPGYDSAVIAYAAAEGYIGEYFDKKSFYDGSYQLEEETNDSA